MLEELGYGGAGGLIGALLSIFGLNNRIRKLEDNKRSVDTCEAIHRNINGQLERIYKELEDIRADIKELLHEIRR